MGVARTGPPAGTETTAGASLSEATHIADDAYRSPMGEARLAELVAALSLGIDLGCGQPMEHVLRQCLISLRLAERLDLDEKQRADVFYTSLPIHVGCQSGACEHAR